MENDPARSQWISTANKLPSLPPGRYTFRTTFELVGASPKSAVLRGRFAADNHVDAIRLNGHVVPVPEHRRAPPFDVLHGFSVRDGFVEGTNVLEIDVFNSPATNAIYRTEIQPNGEVKSLRRRSAGNTPMALLLELHGTAVDTNQQESVR